MNRMLKTLPPFMAEYKETKAICEAELPEFELLNNSSLEAEDDHLIDYASERRITEMEELLNVVPATFLSLNQRKKRLKNYSKQLPSYALFNLISELGNLSYTHTVSYNITYPDYLLEITCNIPSDLWDIYYKKLREIVPANIILECTNEPGRRITGRAWISGCLAKRCLRRIG